MDSSPDNQKTPEINNGNPEFASFLYFLTARNLIASGDLDEAERILREREALTPSIEALDLRARIAVQRGQFGQAGKLWNAVLEKDPNHQAAKAAIKRLNSPWITIALIKRVAVLAGFGFLLFLSIVGVIAMFNWVQRTQPTAGPSPTALAAPSFTIPGFSVNTTEGETKVIFDEGLFSHSCNLKESAAERLSTLAHHLRENATNSRIIIEGHTDSLPVRKNSLYSDNYALGLQRALTVAEVLKSHHRIEGRRILVTSMGDTNPPFPEVDYESKLKNRTVVIRLF